MKSINKIFLFLIAVQSISLRACEFYIHNDGSRTIIVYDATLEQVFEILPKRKKLVGHPQKHAHCSLFYKGKPDKVFELRMIACATPGQSTDVLVSSLSEGIVPPIFEFIKTEKASSTGVPSCSSCAARHK